MASVILCDAIKDVIIVAHKEDTRPLEAALFEEGLMPCVARRSYSEIELSYSQSIRVLLSHIDAWKLSCSMQSPLIICEADFVPCKGFGSFHLPMPIVELAANAGVGWLYACGPTI